MKTILLSGIVLISASAANAENLCYKAKIYAEMNYYTYFNIAEKSIIKSKDEANVPAGYVRAGPNRITTANKFQTAPYNLKIKFNPTDKVVDLKMSFAAVKFAKNITLEGSPSTFNFDKSNAPKEISGQNIPYQIPPNLRCPCFDARAKSFDKNSNISIRGDGTESEIFSIESIEHPILSFAGLENFESIDCDDFDDSENP